MKAVCVEMNCHPLLDGHTKHGVFGSSLMRDYLSRRGSGDQRQALR